MQRIPWTKDEMRKLLDLWETHTLDQIADALGRDKKQVAAMAYQMRKEGIPIVQKRKNGTIRHLIREIMSEL